MTTTTQQGAQPAWEIATLFPDQGYWDEWDYLALNTNRLVEFSDGYVEVLPMPTELHQFIVLFLIEVIRAFVDPRDLGVPLMAPLRVRLRAGKIREPDVVFLLAENESKRGPKFWSGADLVIEVVSEDDPDRDYIQKRQDYAEGRIAECWIADPMKQDVIVLKLVGERYETHGVFRPGDMVSSHLLKGFEVAVDAVLSAGGRARR